MSIEANTIEAITTEAEADAIDPTVEWQTLIDHEDFEICTNEPYQIRKRSNGRIVAESFHKSTGYIQVNLNKKPYLIVIFIIPLYGSWLQQFFPDDQCFR